MKLLTTLSLVCCTLSLSSHAATIDRNEIQFLTGMGQSSQLKPFETPHRQAIVDSLAHTLSNNTDSVTVGTESLTWKRLSSVSALTLEGIQALKYEFSTTRFTQGQFELQGVEKATVYLNGKRLSENNSNKVALATGDHELLIVAEQVADWNKVALEFKPQSEVDQLVEFKEGSPKALSAEQLFDAPTISAVSQSPDGRYYVTTKRHYSNKHGNKAQTETNLFNDKGEILYRFTEASASSLFWSPDSRQVGYINNNQLNVLTIKSLRVNTFEYDLSQTSQWQFINNSTLLFSWSKSTDDNDKITKHFRGLEDRWSYHRNRSHVYSLDLNSGLISAITKGKASYSFEDVNANRGTILVTRHISDYRPPAHALTELLEVNMSTLAESSLGQYVTLNSAKYGNDGIFVTAGPDFKNGLGRTIPEGQLANNYDGQLYWLSFDGKEAKALSRNFDPAIGQIKVINGEDLVMKVTEKDTQPLYLFDVSKHKFTRLNTGFDVVDNFSITNTKQNKVLASGTTASSPQQLITLNLSKNKASIIWDSAVLAYQHNEIATLEEFNFKNQDGVEIEGRVYLPAELDRNKKYPALVYYYGGTSPVSRGFTGRYPFNHWAAQGYIVYVLQPTGATGFGQAFSSAHVNAWGEKTADDIIQGTKAFLTKYDFVDSKKVGNLGASYGGFMTMLLATKTDLFSASIAHAGISNITSYWGQGWWGYLYSGEASKNSFPWNNSTLYSQHSPVFHADKVNSPLLLIHGDADTNVPPGESHNMYTALKILGKDVELVEFKGADHQIFARDRRFKWWDTMLAYFDKHLKEEPQWWDHLYPEEK